MRRYLRFSPALIALAAAGALGASQAGAQGARPASNGQQCFAMKDWQGWKASPDSKTLFISTGPSQVYRLDLATACPDLQNIDARVINRDLSGADYVCSPLDLDLTVYTPPGQSTPCMVKAITPLTKDQVAALPPKERP